jgi:cardiolipin synthase A/B
VLYSERLARELEDSFMRDLEGCREFSVAEYEARSILLRLRDSAARLLSPLL